MCKKYIYYSIKHTFYRKEDAIFIFVSIYSTFDASQNVSVALEWLLEIEEHTEWDKKKRQRAIKKNDSHRRGKEQTYANQIQYIFM